MPSRVESTTSQSSVLPTTWSIVTSSAYRVFAVASTTLIICVMMLAQMVYSEPSAVAAFPAIRLCKQPCPSPIAPRMHPSSSVQITVIVSADLDPDPPPGQLLITGSDALIHRLSLGCDEDEDSASIRYDPSLLSVATHMRPDLAAHFGRLHNVPAFDRNDTNSNGRRPPPLCSSIISKQ